jgi:predicted Fe-Mo cluster-binding NifX family protein
MELLIAFGTDDGEYLTNGHAGDAKYFHLYKFSDNKEEFVEQRRNIELRGDQSLKPGTPEMAKARSAVFKNLDALVGKQFGPGLPNLLKQFVCVLLRVDTLSKAIEVVRNNLDRIREEKDKREDRKHIVLRP